jgi:ubiquinone/menaquinone biosynthesis C-methylase UbiE
MKSVSQFDDLAQTYENWFGGHLGAFIGRLETDLVLGSLRPEQGEAILEVGSGTGYFLRKVSRLGARCVGIEPSLKMLSVATSQALANVDYVRGCGESLPFKAACFDGLFYMTTLEFVQDADAAIQEAGRVVRSGGRLVFGVLNAEGSWARARKREGGLWAEARFFHTRELEALLSQLGAVEVGYCVHLPPQLARLPAPLMGVADKLLRRLFPAHGALIVARVTPWRPQ